MFVKWFLQVSVCCTSCQKKFVFVVSESLRSWKFGFWSLDNQGGAGYIGSHAALFLLENGYHVTALDNLSRGNVGAIHVLQQIAIPGRFNFIKTDLSDLEDVSYSQLCVLYSCGLRVCVHVQSL
jgi:hypothetical protein